MMNMKAMHKDFWMEIRKSKARFISIFMIVALGVAFFSGIQASSPDRIFRQSDHPAQRGRGIREAEHENSLEENR